MALCSNISKQAPPPQPMTNAPEMEKTMYVIPRPLNTVLRLVLHFAGTSAGYHVRPMPSNRKGTATRHTTQPIIGLPTAAASCIFCVDPSRFRGAEDSAAPLPGTAPYMMILSGGQMFPYANRTVFGIGMPVYT